jgi:hypothetical protein
VVKDPGSCEPLGGCRDFEQSSGVLQIGDRGAGLANTVSQWALPGQVLHGEVPLAKKPEQWA